MSRLLPRCSTSRLALAAALAALCATASAATARADGRDLELYTADVDVRTARDLARSGYDVTAARPSEAGRVALQLVLAPREHAVLAARGIRLSPWRAPDGRTATELADAQAQGGFDVWQPFDGPGGVRDMLYAFTRAHPELTKLVVLGTSRQDREIVAVKVTRNAQATPDGARPAALFSSLQHAREWISLEVNRRLMVHLVERYADDPDVRALVDAHEIWFVLVANPDGYQFTHTHERLWRKNLRDNNGDGVVTSGDGVDLNRNFDNHWGYDEEGSSSAPGSGTYRGPSAASEPETQAMQRFLSGLRPAFHVNYHSVASLLLYDQGWQVQTPSPDSPIFKALAGDIRRPAIPGFVPEISANLYITNGETCDYAYFEAGTLCFTPELSDGGSGDGFVFPDDEALVQAEFEKTLPFALDVARSAGDPAHPASHLGNSVPPMVADAFPVSYGDPQPIEVNAARHLGAVTLRFRIDDGPVQTAPATVWPGGRRYDGPGLHYQKWRADVSGAAPGRRVTVWFEAGGVETTPFTYRVERDSGAPLLVVAAEDYTGSLPTYARTDGPSHLDAYTRALDAAGVAHDVYDVDAHGRRAPSPLGVLGHYRAVIWYTGDDVVPREPSMGPGTASKLANDMVLAMRQFLNEGGRLLYTGQYAGMANATEAFVYDPETNAPCGEPGVFCEPLTNDFNQYYLGVDGYVRTIETPIDLENGAGDGRGLWGGRANNVTHTATRAFDLAGAAAPVTLAFDSHWNIEPDYDYGYVEVSTDAGSSWATLADLDGRFTDADPNGQNRGWGLTGAGTGRLRFDLAPHAAVTDTVTLRLTYATDGGTLAPGWWVDNLALTDSGGTRYATDFEGGLGDWDIDGWVTVPPEPPAGPAIYAVTGTGEPFAGLTWRFGAPGAANPDHSAAGVPTSRGLPPDRYPQFRSWNAAFYDDPARRPHDGEAMAYSGGVPEGYLRLTRALDLTGVRAAGLSFWVNHDVDPQWDAVFVEARTAGGDDWTTLPDQNGHTSPDTALTCQWPFILAAHPQLEHYMTYDGSGPTCRPTGSTGAWHAANGASGGWQPWRVDLSPFAGRAVEVSISYLGWTGATGVFVDDVEATTGDATSFEDGWGGWTATGPPPESPPNPGLFHLATAADFPAGAVVVTPDTIFFGFGFEGIATEAERNAVMGRAVGYMLRPYGRAYLPVVAVAHALRP